MISSINFDEMIAYNFNFAFACDQVPGCDNIPCNCNCDKCDCDTCNDCVATCNK